MVASCLIYIAGSLTYSCISLAPPTDNGRPRSIVSLVDCSTQATDKYKRHSRVICYCVTNHLWIFHQLWHAIVISRSPLRWILMLFGRLLVGISSANLVRGSDSSRVIEKLCRHRVELMWQEQPTRRREAASFPFWHYSRFLLRLFRSARTS